MVEAANKGEIKEVNVWVEEKRWIFMCPTLWTPFNDQIKENTFESLVSGNIRYDQMDNQMETLKKTASGS